jgi:hypothetical protein
MGIMVRNGVDFRKQYRTGDFKRFVLIEGDSWVFHPLLYDLSDQFALLSSPDTLIYNTGWHGDRAADIFKSNGSQMRRVKRILENDDKEWKGKFDLIFLSAAGNDIVGPEIRNERFVSAKNDLPGAYGRELITENFRSVVSEIGSGYSRFLELAASLKRSRATPVISHCYCYLQPRTVGTHLGDVFFNKGWVAVHLESLGITDPAEQHDIICAMLDAFLAELGKVRPARRDQKFLAIDTRNALQKNGQIDLSLWKDEIHPENEGFRRVAEFIHSAINGDGIWPSA